MDVSAIANLATRMSQQRTADAADVLVLKKALQTQEQAAMTLIAAVTPSAGLAEHLGRNINVVA
jgi:tRNA A-37 threonylcarbamoyl transferase component Bud32